MAKTIAKARGYDSQGKETTWATRLGRAEAEAQANTYRTFTTCYVRGDGSGHVEVKRDGKTLHSFEFGKE